ncbi:regulator of chromosome condensation [Anaeramoeba flamelloides]|uniref:Regulator of chromosome condensation n=1 Tax=Anaeramoeba flamelloides TaxID=1746091 RepID=A0ABQ8XKU9_9EUKA|nr:regulator of chromosome condensation [Anaeramoeba flamelloides]
MYKIFGCGENSNSQMGRTGKFSTFTFLENASGYRIKQVSPCYEKTFYLTEDNKLVEFGLHVSGSQTPKIHTIKDEIIKSVSGGTYHALILTESGKVYGIRQNSSGQCGLEKTSLDEPTLVTFFTKKGLLVKEVCCSYYNSYFLCTNGELYGAGNVGNLGLTGNQVQNGKEPVLITKGIFRVFSGPEAGGFLALTEKLELVGGGSTYTTMETGSGCRKVLNPPEEPIKCACLGFSSCMVLTSDGKVYTSGSLNNIGRPQGSDINKLKIVPKLKDKFVTKISIGQDQSICTTSDYEIYVWGGDNSYGQQGIGHNNSSTIVKKIVIPEIENSPFINVVCGLYNTFVYTAPDQGEFQDFLTIFKESLFTDSVLQNHRVHKSLIEARTDKTFSQVKQCLEENYSEDEIKEFLIWVYGGYPKKMTGVKKITKELGIQDFFKRDFTKDLSRIYRDDDSKDFNLAVVVDDEDNEDEEENEDEEDEEVEEIPVHKFVLVARSGLFREMFKTINQNASVVKDYSGKTVESLEILIKYFYTEKIELTADDDPVLVVEELYDAVDYYQLNKFSNLQYQLDQIKKNF